MNGKTMESKHLLLLSFLAFFATSLVSMEKKEVTKIANLLFGLPKEVQPLVTSQLTLYDISERKPGEEGRPLGGASFKFVTEALGKIELLTKGFSSGEYKQKIFYVGPVTQHKSLVFSGIAFDYGPFQNPTGEQYRCMGPFTIDGTKVVMIDQALMPFPEVSWSGRTSIADEKRIKINTANAALKKVLGKNERCTSVDARQGTLYTVKSDGSVDSLSYQNDESFVRSSFKPPLSEALIKEVEQSFIERIKPKAPDFTFMHDYDFNIENPNFLLDIYPFHGGLCAVINRKDNTHTMYGGEVKNSGISALFDTYPSIWSGPSMETRTILGTQIASVREISVKPSLEAQFLTVVAAHHFCSLKEDERSVEAAKDIIDAVKEMPLGSERYRLVWCSEKDGKYALKDVYTWLKRKSIKPSKRLYD
jgi:hypothetical protein